MIWDRWQPHKAKAVRAFLFHPPAVGFVFLPSYAPELNPVEYVWNHLKTNLRDSPGTDQFDHPTAEFRGIRGA